MLFGVGVISASLEFVFKQSLTSSAQDDIEAIGETFKRESRLDVECGDQTFDRGFVWNGPDN
jgi:hypothetical protein